MTQSHCESSPGSHTLWMQNSARRLPTFGPSRQTWAIGPFLGGYELWNYIHHRHLLLLNPKADTNFTIPLRVEGWLDLDAMLVTYPDGLPARKQSPIQVLTGPSDD